MDPSSPSARPAPPEGIVGAAAAPVAPPSAASRPAVRDALPTLVGGSQPAGALALTHGGAGSPPALQDGPQAAADAARARRRAGAVALTAAIAGTVVLEDDPRFNAGTGSNIRLDGATIQMDAALMTGDGRFAAVAVIERVRNPIRAARLVLDSPHILLAGDGATRFAHRMGLADEVPRAPEAEAKYARRLADLKAARADGRDAVDWEAYWNFPGEMPAELKAWRRGGDTVGTVVRDAAGRFAATLSTGGTSVTLRGRVGDVPIFGAGLFAGEEGAVACTGDGEVIVRESIARRTYEAIAAGVPAKEAVEAAALAFPPGAELGIIAVDRGGYGVASTTSMAHGLARG